MKTIKIKIYNTKVSKLRGTRGEDDRDMDTRDLIEVVLDQVPQGGFAPKDIRDRNRIQRVIDESRESDKKENQDTLNFEDEDFKNLSTMVGTSRWGSRDKDLVDFLEIFDKSNSE
jgi:hypothetical protein